MSLRGRREGKGVFYKYAKMKVRKRHCCDIWLEKWQQGRGWESGVPLISGLVTICMKKPPSPPCLSLRYFYFRSLDPMLQMKCCLKSVWIPSKWITHLYYSISHDDKWSNAPQKEFKDQLSRFTTQLIL